MLRISQNLSLQQKMAPQLIQSLQLLQMSTLELEMEIKQQMELNPMLEEGMEQEENSQDADADADADDGLKEEEELPEDMEQIDWDALLEDQFDQGSYNSERTEYDPNWETDREPQENRITVIPPLVDQLREQLVLGDLTETTGRDRRVHHRKSRREGISGVFRRGPRRESQSAN